MKQHPALAGITLAELGLAYLAATRGLVEKKTHGKGIRKSRINGIGKAAEVLGVTRVHLYLVISGKRRSPRIERWLARNYKKGGVE